MKRTVTLIACVAVCCAMTMSCKNKKTTEPTPEEIQAQKVALADSVLAQIDAIFEEYEDASVKGKIWEVVFLTEEERMVKPDYLLDPSYASTLATKSQKVNALAVYIVDCAVRHIYGMPLDETKGVIAKLAAELNHPIDDDFITGYEMSESEIIKKEYEVCRERGDLVYFWQFQNAIIAETSYIIAQNPELFFSKITDEQWQAFVTIMNEKNKAIRELAKYDNEMAAVLEMFNQTKVVSEEEKEKISASIESEIKFRLANKDKFIAYRNALLQ